jgi:hypothetical protein
MIGSVLLNTWRGERREERGERREERARRKEEGRRTWRHGIYYKYQETQHFTRTMTDKDKESSRLPTAPTGMPVTRGQKGLKNHTVIPQEVLISSLSSALGVSVAGAIQDQRASVANVKLVPFQEKATEFKLMKKKNHDNRLQSKFWKFDNR